MKWIAYNTLSIVSLLSAVFLIYTKSGHWGWFLCLSAITFVYPISNEKK